VNKFGIKVNALLSELMINWGNGKIVELILMEIEASIVGT
jgi:hypothetical protein